MNYDQFRAVWHEALAEVGLTPFFPGPSETIDLERFSRTYKIIVSLGSFQRAGPFSINATLSWRWDATLAARSATTEEDLLTEVLGRDADDMDTQQPWLRIDLKLRAGLPLDSPLPIPKPAAWRHWTTEATTRLEPLLPSDSRLDKHGLMALSWRGGPEVRLQCSPDSRLLLAAVELSAWQGINLPRQWDNPNRLPDPEPYAQLVDFAVRVGQALQTWQDCLPYLHPAKGR